MLNTKEKRRKCNSDNFIGGQGSQQINLETMKQ